MKQYIGAILFLSLILISCGKSDKALLSIEINNANSEEVIISKLLLNQMTVIDTLKTDTNGKIQYRVNNMTQYPDFYYLTYGDNKLIPMIIAPGDKIKVTAEKSGKYEITGSSDSNLLKEQEDMFSRRIKSFDSLAVLYESAVNRNDSKEAEIISQQMGRTYVNTKRDALKFVMTNSKSLSIIPVIYRKISDEILVFGEASDFILFKQLYDSLQPLYKESPYVLSLADEIGRRESLIVLDEHFSQAGYSSFPDIINTDINSKQVRLSELEGQVIILSFWVSTDVNQRVFNTDLKEIYEKYHHKGLEVYQVSLDTDKAYWANTVREQKLPWISVCDGLGTQTLSIGTYNINKLPAMFIMDKQGDIVDKDVFDEVKLEALIKRLTK